MNSEEFMFMGLLAALGLAGLTIAIGSWLPRRKKLPDWLMAIGSTTALLGFALLVLEYFESYLGGGIEAVFLVFGPMAMGTLVFSMGFLIERGVRWRMGQHDSNG